jgi:hypothetical protein
MKFLVPPPLPNKPAIYIAQQLGRNPIANHRFMVAMSIWSKVEQATAIDVYRKKRLRKAELFVKYSVTPAQILALHPAFQEIYNVTEAEWSKLTIKQQRTFATACAFYEGRKKAPKWSS